VTAQHVYTLLPDKPDDRDWLYKATGPATTIYPDYVDMRPSMPPIFSQGGIGSCTANAITAAREYAQLVAGLPWESLSRLFVYWYERVAIGQTANDAGAYMRDGYKLLADIGVPPETLWPYIESAVNTQPSAVALTAARPNRIFSYERLMGKWPIVQDALAHGKPVAIGILVYESFESDATNKTGMIAMPNITTEKLLGGHAVLVVGYKKIGGDTYAIIRNSWGVGYGDAGYYYMPTAYFDAPMLVNDMWTLNAYPTADMLTFDAAIDILTANGIFDTAVFWKTLGAKYANDGVSDFRYVQLAFRKIAAWVANHGGSL
jgi:C1A family cysteine protease